MYSKMEKRFIFENNEYFINTCGLSELFLFASDIWCEFDVDLRKQVQKYCCQNFMEEEIRCTLCNRYVCKFCRKGDICNSMCCRIKNLNFTPLGILNEKRQRCISVDYIIRFMLHQWNLFEFTGEKNLEFLRAKYCLSAIEVVLYGKNQKRSLNNFPDAIPGLDSSLNVFSSNLSEIIRPANAREISRGISIL